MQVIFDALAGISRAISSAFGWLQHIIQEALDLAKLVGGFVSSLPSFFSFLPPAAVALLVSIFSVVALYKILGRE